MDNDLVLRLIDIAQRVIAWDRMAAGRDIAVADCAVGDVKYLFAVELVEVMGVSSVLYSGMCLVRRADKREKFAPTAGLPTAEIVDICISQ